MAERRTFDLDELRADGWFEQLAEEAPNFEELCQILGPSFVAFSVIAGVRINSIALDPHVPAATIIEFGFGNGGRSIQLPLPEFRERLAMTLVVEDTYPDGLDTEPDVAALQRFIGGRYILLAAFFEMRLLELQVDGGEVPVITFEAEGLQHEIPLNQFRAVLDDRVRAEAAHDQASPFAIDLAAIPEAVVAASDGAWDRVIELLSSWPGPLSLLLRTQEGQALEQEVRSTLAKALGLLGTAYSKTGRHEFAEEVMRLGIQWGQDSAVAGDLFRRLGESYLERGLHGQAIGLLRRAMSLGALQRDILPMLAECFYNRGRYVAAAVCLDDAIATGSEARSLDDLAAKLKGVFGDRWTYFRKLVPAASSTEPTVRPPAK